MTASVATVAVAVSATTLCRVKKDSLDVSQRMRVLSCATSARQKSRASTLTQKEVRKRAIPRKRFPSKKNRDIIR
jgi:hypothetical protein